MSVLRTDTSEVGVRLRAETESYSLYHIQTVSGAHLMEFGFRQGHIHIVQTCRRAHLVPHSMGIARSFLHHYSLQDLKLTNCAGVEINLLATDFFF